MSALVGAIERKARELGVWSEHDFWYGDTLPLFSCHPDGWYRLDAEAGSVLAGPTLASLWLLCHAAGLGEALMRAVKFAGEAREQLIAESDRLQSVGDPIGTVLALWLAGKLEERHVLGVERVSASAKDREGERGLIADEWTRPILEANP